MLAVNTRNAATWASLGSRATFGLALAELGKDVDDLMVLTADTSTSAGLERFKKAFPDKFLDVGIAEQNMVGIAAGLASEGATVVTATFAPFQTMRCCEQIRVNLGYMGHKVTMAGLASGVVLGNLGYTHCCVEDVAVMRAIPGMVVLSPADCGETVKAVTAALADSRPVYIRLTGGKPNPPVYTSDYEFAIGKGVRLRDGGDVAIVAAGSMVHRALRSAELLAEQGLAAGVVDMHTLKPIDAALVAELAGAARLLVTVEEHSILGGLGAAVSEVLSGLSGAPPLLRLGLPDAFGKGGDYEDLLADAGLAPDALAHSIVERHARL